MIPPTRFHFCSGLTVFQNIRSLYITIMYVCACNDNVEEERERVDTLLRGCYRQETVSQLLNHMFAGDELVDSVVTSGLLILHTLLEFRRIGYA